MRVLLPAFPDLRKGVPDSRVVKEFDALSRHGVLLYGRFNGVGIYLIDIPDLYDRHGSPYHDQDQFAYMDNYLRFAILGWVGAEMATGLDPAWRPDIVHAHDWHAGLTCAYLAAKGRPAKSVFTVHNLAYQGLFSPRHLPELQLPDDFFQTYGFEFYGQISYMKAGLFYADHVTTVSPTYAREITQPAYGYGMKGLLASLQTQGQLSGILNGVDDAIWNPTHDAMLATRYNRDVLEAKVNNKRHLQTAMGLTVDEKVPLFAVVSRLTSQKGLDLVQEVLPDLLEQGGPLTLLGAGDATLQQGFLAAAAEYPSQVGVQLGYHEAFSHRIIGGSDVLMVPSRFEPCGLTQLYALKYGTLPLVRRTGGLADTVTDSSLENLSDGVASGFVFEDATAAGLQRAIRRAFVLWSRPSLWRYCAAAGDGTGFQLARCRESLSVVVSTPLRFNQGKHGHEFTVYLCVTHPQRRGA